MKKITVVNIFNFIRRAHEEPSTFIQDDFDTIKNQMEVLKQYGLPSTYALKHDALIDPQYQQLIRDFVDPYDELAVWWEITEELCQRAGVTYKGANSDIFDNRVSSGYSIGYTHDERKLLLDAYMRDFKAIFGVYPKTIASWVIDIVTLEYAHQQYGLVGGALCRDQIGTDGFTLWGGYINGAFYPSRYNEIMPAQSLSTQVDMPLFRLLGPDPIYNFESDLRQGVQGVYSLEPVWPTGRNPLWIQWLFDCLTEEDTIGMNYAQVGQENNFLWENIKPGFELQLCHIKSLAEQGKLRIETLAESAQWFKQKYKTTPPATYQASSDWNDVFDLKTLWYSSKHYRVSFLFEANQLSIRDLFVYHEDYCSRYLNHLMEGNESIFDALPIMNPHYWSQPGKRARIDFLNMSGQPLLGPSLTFKSLGEHASQVHFESDQGTICVTAAEETLTIQGPVQLALSDLPVLTKITAQTLHMRHCDFDYTLKVLEGSIKNIGDHLHIVSVSNRITLQLAQKIVEREIYTQDYINSPQVIDGYKPHYLTSTGRLHQTTRARPPIMSACDTVKVLGDTYTFTLAKPYEDCAIHYTLDGSEPTQSSPLYITPLTVSSYTCLKAKTFKPGLPPSQTCQSKVYFSQPVLAIESSSVFDERPLFNHNGAYDLLDGHRGSLDYQDGHWLGTTDDLDVTLTLAAHSVVNRVTIGFLTHHRSGLIYPESVTLYAGNTPHTLHEIACELLPQGPAEREIAKYDVSFNGPIEGKYLRIFVKNQKIYPSWCCYKGLPGAFVFADHIVIE